jgi:hypothetical protein
MKTGPVANITEPRRASTAAVNSIDQGAEFCEGRERKTPERSALAPPLPRARAALDSIPLASGNRRKPP